MTAKVVTFSNKKGGVGKTTTCMTLASTFGLRGHKVIVLDSDADKPDSMRWYSAAADDAPMPITVVSLGPAADKPGREVKKYLDLYDFVFVDCPGAAGSPAHKSAYKVSDLVMIPVTLSSLDIRAALSLKPLFEEVEEDNPKLKTLLVANQVTLRSRLARETMEDVLPELGFRLAKTTYGNRDTFREIPNEGLPVQGLGRAAAALIAEVEGLADEIFEILKGE